MALSAMAYHFGRPGTPSDEAWSRIALHVRTEHPHLLAIADPAVLRAELTVVRSHIRGARFLAQGTGTVTGFEFSERLNVSV